MIDRKVAATILAGITAFLTIGAITQLDYNTQIKNKPTINITDYPYSAVCGTDASAAVTAAFAALPSAGGTIHFPTCASGYEIRSVAGRSNTTILCDGGVGATLLKNSVSGPMFTFATGSTTTFSDVTIQGCSISGAGATLFQAAAVGVGSGYLNRFTIAASHFSANMAYAIYGNLIFLDFGKSDCGYFGSVGTNTSCIYSKGNAGADQASNFNYVHDSGFYNTTANQAVYFESGYQLRFEHNDSEGNNPTGSNPAVVRVLGQYSPILLYNWFERNTGAQQVYYNNDFTGTVGNYISQIWGNWVDLSASGNTHFIDLNGAVTYIDSRYNGGVMTAGQHFFCYANANCDDVGVSNSQYNRFIGSYAGFNRVTIDGNVILNGAPNSLLYNFGCTANDGARFVDTGNSNNIVAQILCDGSHVGEFDAYNSAGVKTAQINGNPAGSTFFANGVQAPGINSISSEDAGSVSNAIKGTLAGIVLSGGHPPTGTCVTQLLNSHTMQSGANTFALNSGTAYAIKKHTNPSSDIGTAYGLNGTPTLCWNGSAYLDQAQ